MTARVATFTAVGAMGLLVQLGALAGLTMLADWPYLPATGLAVELAVLHNFWWHERWTWRDRRRGPAVVSVTARFARFHVATCVTSVAGNLVLTAAAVELAALPPMAANLVAVGALSVLNFIMADRWVFRQTGAVAAASVICVAAAPGVAGAVEPPPRTIAAWNAYVTATESAIGPDRAGAPAGAPEGETIAVPGGTIHRWRGSIVVRGVTLDALLHSLQYPGTPPPQEEVLESRVLGRSGSSIRVHIRLVRRALVTATYDTEHEMTFTRHRPDLATSRSVATRIEEVGGGDRGFLWRLNSYWRYVQQDDGVRVDLESLSLSRDIPALVRPVAGPIVGRIARESVRRTLEALRRRFEGSPATG